MDPRGQVLTIRVLGHVLEICHNILRWEYPFRPVSHEHRGVIQVSVPAGLMTGTDSIIGIYDPVSSGHKTHGWTGICDRNMGPEMHPCSALVKLALMILFNKC